MVPAMKPKIQENIGSHFLDHAVELVKEGKKFVLVLDNIDWEVKVQCCNVSSQKINTGPNCNKIYTCYNRGNIFNKGR